MNSRLYSVGDQPRGAPVPLDAASVSTINDELRGGPYSPEYLWGRSESFERDALILAKLGERDGVNQSLAVAAALAEEARRAKRSAPRAEVPAISEDR